MASLLEEFHFSDKERKEFVENAFISKDNLSIKSSQKLFIAIACYFVYEGSVIGIWAALIPEVKKLQGLSDFALGLVLLSSCIGSLFGMPLIAYSIDKLGSANTAVCAGIFTSVFIPIIGIKGPIWVLVIGVIVLSFGLAAVDVCLNAQSVLLERIVNDNRLGICLCAYAVGGLIGSLIGGVLANSSLTLLVDFIIASTISIVPISLSYFWLCPFSDEKNINSNYHENKIKDNLPSDSETLNNNDLSTSLLTVEEQIESSGSTKKDYYILLISLSVLGGIGFFAEGSIGDWSSIYLQDYLGASPFIGSLGFVAFQLMIAIGRFFSDTLQKVYSRRRLVQLAGICSCLGLLLSVLSVFISVSSVFRIILAIIGFGLCGAGISVVTPIVISCAGTNIKGMNPADAIALVSSFTFIGWLFGPVIIGGLSAAFGSLTYALLADALLILIISIIGTIYGKRLK